MSREIVTWNFEAGKTALHRGLREDVFEPPGIYFPDVDFDGQFFVGENDRPAEFDVLQDSCITDPQVKAHSRLDAKRTGQHDHVLEGVIGEVREQAEPDL